MYASLHIHIYTYFARVCASLCKCMCVWACPTNVALVHFRVFIAHSFNQTCIWFSCSFIHAFICVSTDFCLYESLFCLPSSPVFPLFLFSFILRTNRHFLCAIFDSRATATSATNVLIRLEFQLHLFAPFRIHSNSALIITVKTKTEGAWQLLYASFKVTKCWFIEGLDGKTNRNSLNFTWLNVLHKFFISFTQLPWHFVQEK